MSDVEKVGNHLNETTKKLNVLPFFQQTAAALVEMQVSLPANQNNDNTELRTAHQAVERAQEKLAEQYNAVQAIQEMVMAYAASLGVSHRIEPPIAMSHLERPPLPRDPVEDEQDIFEQRVKEVEREIAQGDNGKPTKFLSGLEVELKLVDVREAIKEYNLPFKEEDLPRAMEGSQKGFIPEYSGELVVLNAKERDQRIEQLRTEARTYVENLTPTNSEETARQQAWLGSIDTLNSVDLVNFSLYREFSTPTLGETSPPKNATLEEVQNHATQNGWIEFRFGNGILQSGYYDNEGVCEFRLNPCSPSELVEREKIINHRMLEISAELGVGVTPANTHLNVSAYQASEEEPGKWQPVLGVTPEKREQTLDAVAGLGEVMKDGLWMNSDNAENKFLMGSLGKINPWEISSNRTDLRVPGEYVELRNKELKGSTEQGLIWVMTGISHGLEQGRSSNEDGPQMKHMVTVERTEVFDKEKDLQLQRMIESGSSKEQPDGIFRPDPKYARQRGEKFAKDILGEPLLDKKAGEAFAHMMIEAVYPDIDGRLHIDPETFVAACRNLSPMMWETLKPHIEHKGPDYFYEKAEAYIERDAVRVSRDARLTYDVPNPGLRPEEWNQRWEQSLLMRRAYGEHTAKFIDHLTTIIAEHYTDVDLSNPAVVEAIIRELEEKEEKNQ